jgi:glycosyltransferase involved in cell wall biosynthesis
VLQDLQLAEPGWTMREVRFGRYEAPAVTHIWQKARELLAAGAFQMGIGSSALAEAAQARVTTDLIRATCAAPRADIYIAHYTAALPAAARAAHLHGTRYAFDAEDFHLGDLPDRPEYRREKAVIRHIEQAYLPGATYISAASPLIARAYADTYGIAEPATILNVLPRASAPAGPTPAGTADPGPSLYWFSQTIGPGRGLETAIKALALCCSKPHFYIRGTFAAGYEEALTRLAGSLDVMSRIHFLEPVYPDDLERAGAVYDIGFSGETGSSPNYEKALANKTFSYMCSGLPVILSSTPAYCAFAADKSDYAFLFQDAADLAAAIDRLLTEPTRLAASRAAAFNAAASIYNWERESQTLLKLVEAAVGRGGSVSQHHAPTAEACR